MKILTAISDYLGVESDIVNNIVEQAPENYRRYKVAKASGGFRWIYHPAKETKAVQVAAINLLDYRLLISSSAYGYVRGLKRPLYRNAEVHKDKKFLLKLDFNDFFPSIKPNDFVGVCTGKLGMGGVLLAEEDYEFLIKLFFVFNSNMRLQWFLGIGAPSSPFVSNWVMSDLDSKILLLADKFGVVYTRYADDLCFSSDEKNALLSFEDSLKDLVAQTRLPRLTFNNKKKRFASKNTRKRICGLTVTPIGEVKIPRDFKRKVRTLIYKFKEKELDDKAARVLGGYLGYIKDSEPEYLNNLSMKFGANAIRSAMKNKNLI